VAIVGMTAVAVVVGALASACSGQSSVEAFADPSWQKQFGISKCSLSSTGRSRYFVLEPGFRIVLEGGHGKLAVTVLDETRVVSSVETRVVEEREWNDGKLIEVSRNYFAFCPATKDAFYFGEEVDDVENGEVVGHAGAWLAGENGARAGLIMPGRPKVGMKYYQEIAPDVALDRAEILAFDETFETPAGVLTGCLRTEEGTALDPGEKEQKTYAPGVGLVQDENLLLTGYGFAQPQ
jgi:hypothetical protein